MYLFNFYKYTNAGAKSGNEELQQSILYELLLKLCFWSLHFDSNSDALLLLYIFRQTLWGKKLTTSTSSLFFLFFQLCMFCIVQKQTKILYIIMNNTSAKCINIK